MATKRPYLLPAVTAFRSDDKIIVDSQTNGTGAMSKDDLLKETAENAQDYLGECVDKRDIAFVAKVSHDITVTVQSSGINENGNYGKAGEARIGRRNDYNRVHINSSTYEIRPFYYSDNTTNPWSGAFVRSGRWGHDCYNDGTLYMAVAVRRADGQNIGNDELATIDSALQFYIAVDNSLTKSGVPADSKIVGDSLSAIGYDKDLNPISEDSSKYVNALDGSLVASTSNNYNYKFELIPNASYTASGRIGTNTAMCFIAYYDEDDQFISSLNQSEGTSVVFTNLEIDPPANAKYVRIQGYNGVQMPVLHIRTGIFRNDNNDPFFAGKYLSVIGASTCTYQGYIPENYPYYYPRSGVTSVYQMWWQRVCDSLGMNRLVIEAWSGSKVSDIGAGVDYSEFVPMAAASRCQNLHTNEHEPDIIIVQGGINDFSKVGDVLGDWNGGELPDNISNFRNALAVMVNRIQTRYPAAMLFLCGLPQFCRTWEDPATGYETSHNEHKSFADYNKSIRDICDICGCNYIDLDGVYSRTGLLQFYCASTGGKTHPNALGHELWANRIISVLKNSHV